MGVGKKGGGKHWTKREDAARKKAAEAFERKDDAKIKPPIWLGTKAREIWDKKLGEINGLNGGTDLLDALDGEVLALYCDAIVLYKTVSKKRYLKIDDHKLLQAYMVRILAYSERLGFTPASRARLIKKRADEKPKDGLHDFD